MKGLFFAHIVSGKLLLTHLIEFVRPINWINAHAGSETRNGMSLLFNIVIHVILKGGLALGARTHLLELFNIPLTLTLSRR